jgi:hypothetical protein
MPEVGDATTIIAILLVLAALLPMDFDRDMMGLDLRPIPVLGGAATNFCLFAASRSSLVLL